MAAAKTECLNPNTGRKMFMETGRYEPIRAAIIKTLQGGKALTWTQLSEGVQNQLKKDKTPFEGSVEWYAISVKNDLEARGIIESFTEKGKKLNKLKE
jgi:hypothetical protein